MTTEFICFLIFMWCIIGVAVVSCVSSEFENQNKKQSSFLVAVGGPLFWIGAGIYFITKSLGDREDQ